MNLLVSGQQSTSCIFVIDRASLAKMSVISAAAYDTYVSWPHEFGHGMAKLSYGAWERESVISSWMIHQGRTGMDARLGSRSEGLSTQRSVA
jgi:hypothetical protein